jgi:DNA-nicking Smr family endonuclease
MSSKKKKKRESASGDAPVKRPDDGFRPFASLRGLDVKLERTPRSSGQAAGGKIGHKPGHPRKTPSPPPPPSEDEVLTLHRMMSGVTPLESRSKRIPRSQASLPSGSLEHHKAHAEAAATKEVESVRAHLRALVEGGRFEVEDDGRRVEGRRAGTSAELLRKLRRGLVPIDARLDMHGMRSEEARDGLERFLGDKRSRGERCVLVVHGKGDHSPGRTGVLRGEIAAWLSQGGASVHVEAFATAQPEDGGEGAVYVLLVR